MSSANTQKLPGSLAEITRMLTREKEGHLINANANVKQEWMTRLLAIFNYNNLSREDKGIIRKYILRETGYSRAQSTRLIRVSLQTIAEQGADKILGNAISETLTVKKLIRNATEKFWSRRKELISHPKFRTWSIGLSSTALCFSVLYTVMQTSTEPLQFLTANVGGSWNLSDDNINSISEKNLRSTAFGQPISIVTAMRVLDSATGNTNPLFYQNEIVNQFGNIESNSVLSASANLSSLVENVANRRKSRLWSNLIPSPIRTWISSTKSEFAIEEHVSGRRVISLSGATIPQVWDDKSTVPVQTAQTYNEYSQDVVAILQRTEERRLQRLANMNIFEDPKTLHSSATDLVGDNLISYNGNVLDFLGEGREGEILMIVNGQPMWKHIVMSEVNEDSPHGGYISRGSGGSGRGGGSAGETGNTGAQGPQGPAGPTLGIYNSLVRRSEVRYGVWLGAGDAGDLQIYNLSSLAVGTSSTGSALTISGSTILGNLTTGAIADAGLALEVVGTMSGTSLHASNTLSSSGALIVEGTTTMRQTTNGSTILYANRVTDTAPSGDFILYRNAADDTTLFRVDNSGIVHSSGFNSSGALTITDTSQPQFRVQYDGSNEWTSSTTSTGVTVFAFNGDEGQLRFIPEVNSTTAFQFMNASGTPVMNIDTTTGNVGIGTATPSEKLHISGTINNNNILLQRTDSTHAYGELQFAGSDGIVKTKIKGYTYLNEGLTFWTNSLERMRIDTGGNVGIGTTSPT
ncbi:MAG: hypothetical protein KAS32_27460, partial [Candidatus Peribacteraceae bacterium]|nr:hypothetical protein [Candidatus Peribacteraceae bacterium]